MHACADALVNTHTHTHVGVQRGLKCKLMLSRWEEALTASAWVGDPNIECRYALGVGVCVPTVSKCVPTVGVCICIGVRMQDSPV